MSEFKRAFTQNGWQATCENNSNSLERVGSDTNPSYIVSNGRETRTVSRGDWVRAQQPGGTDQDIISAALFFSKRKK